MRRWAFGTRSWAVALLGGMLFAFGWAWTREDGGASRTATDRDAMASVRETMNSTRDEATRVATRLSRDRWARDLAPQVVEDYRAGLTPSMGWPAGEELSEAGRDSIRAVLTQPDIARLTDADIAIGLYIDSHPRTVGRGPQAASILGVHDGTPYCIRVVSMVEGSVHSDHFLRWARRRYREPEPSDQDEVLRSSWRSDLMSGCTFVHRHGMPGDAIRAWLGARSSWSGADFDWLPDNLFSARKASELANDPLDVGSVLTGDFPLYGINVVLRGCLAGERRECMKEFIPDGMVPGSPGPTTVVETPPPSFVASLGTDLLDQIETEFGPEAFQAFWTSEESFDVAFAAAFGIHPADWVRSRALQRHEALRAGPGPSADAAGTSVLLMLIGVGLGTLAAIGRRVS